MKNKLPEIRIQDAWLLRDNVSKHLNELWGKGKLLADDKDMKTIVNNYRKAWDPYEQKILNGMADLLGLDFKQNIIDVYIAPWFFAFSDPMIIGVIYKPDVFIDILSHELLHRLLTDNISTPYDKGLLIPEWQRMFGKKHTFTMIVHIPVHAALKAIYLDILKQPERLERDIDRHKENKSKDYIDAWEYVEENDYKEIIKNLRLSYEKLSKK
jgi:hypothetical protein